MNLETPELNRVFIAGKLTRDPELRYTQAGVPICNIRIVARKKHVKPGEDDVVEATYVGVQAWNRTAEQMFEELRKGSSILVTGDLISGEWMTREGDLKASVEIRADRFQLLSKSHTDAV